MASVWSQSEGCAAAASVAVGTSPSPPGRDRGRSSGWTPSPRTCLSRGWGEGWRSRGCFPRGWIGTGRSRGGAPRCRAGAPRIRGRGGSWERWCAVAVGGGDAGGGGETGIGRGGQGTPGELEAPGDEGIKLHMFHISISVPHMKPLSDPQKRQFFYIPF